MHHHPGGLRRPRQHPNRLAVRPALAAEDAQFLSQFAPRLMSSAARACGGRESDSAPHPARVARRLWPGQPAGSCPWTPCVNGCCLVLICTGRPSLEAACGWLRFLLTTFLVDHEVAGSVEVGRGGVVERVLVIEAGEVFEGFLDAPDGWPW